MSTKDNINGLPLAFCKCGVKILIIPDVKAMDRAIEAHLSNCPLIKQSEDKSATKGELYDHIITEIFKVTAYHPLKKKAEQNPLLEGDTSRCH